METGEERLSNLG